MKKELFRPENKPQWIKLLKRLPWLLLIPLGFALPAISAYAPEFVERWFNQGLFPVVSRALGWLFDKIPFSFAEYLLYALVIGLVGLLIVKGILVLLKKIPPVKLVSFLLSLCIAAGAMLNAFYFLWGFSYSRPRLATLLELNVQARPPEELVSLTWSLAEAANALREQVPEDADGVFTTGEMKETFSMIPAAYEALGSHIPFFEGSKAHTPKPVFASETLSWAGISGIYIPFTGECNVNIHQADLLIPVSAAHEAAHGLGIAREDEANFVGYLACMASDDVRLHYSAIMMALLNCSNLVYKLSPELYRQLYSTYSPGVKRDLAAYGTYWDAYEGPVEETVTKVNDTYLKHNQQQSGVLSYGEMVDLLLAWYFG